MDNILTDVVSLQEQTGQMIKQIYSNAEVSKGIDTTAQPVGYNLSPLVTCLEPMWEKFNIFLKKIPRVGPADGQNGKTAKWWQIDSVVNGMSSSYEGGLGSENATKTTQKEVPYKTIAVYDFVTHEAQAAGEGFLDAKGTSVIRALRKIRQKEEYKILGGNITVLATVAAPSVAIVAGGTITTGAYSVKVAPLTAECLQSLIVNLNVDALKLVPYLDKNNAAIAGRFWGTGLPSAAQSFNTTAGNNTATITITPNPDAFAYAIYVQYNGTGNYTLQAITTYSVFTLTKYFTAGEIAATVDGSADALSFDGLLPQIVAGSSFNVDKGYTQFTAAETGVVEINTVLAGIFDAYKICATNIYVSGDLRDTITQANIKKGGVFAVTQTAELGNMTVGRTVGAYIHPSTGEMIEIQTHPYLPKGTCLITTEQLDLPELGVSNVIEMHVAQDYFQRDVYSQNRTFPFEVYAYEALGMRTPQYNAIIKNVKAGLV